MLVATALRGVDLARTVWLLAAGKAAPGMAAAAAATLGPRVRRGLVISPGAVPIRSPIPNVDFAAGGHPAPTRDSELAGRRALALAAAATPDERLLVLLSGGASALMAVPSAPLTLEDKRLTSERLMLNGADIYALNTVRKHLSDIKGGQLAAACAAPCLTFAISDVVGDDLSVIGSGPTVPDASTFGDAYDMIRRYGGVAGCREQVVAHLRRGLDGDLADTPKPGDPRLARSEGSVIGGRRTAMSGAEREATRLRYYTTVIGGAIVGDARPAAARYAEAVRELARSDARRPLCVVSSGETTVRVTGSGRGGRNQEFALALAQSMDGFVEEWIAASVGTDGVDGPTDAAGAIVDGGTAERAAAAELGPARRFLDNNDTYTYFTATGDLVRTGPTGTNVGDLQIFLLA